MSILLKTPIFIVEIARIRTFALRHTKYSNRFANPSLIHILHTHSRLSAIQLVSDDAHLHARPAHTHTHVAQGREGAGKVGRTAGSEAFGTKGCLGRLESRRMRG